MNAQTVNAALSTRNIFVSEFEGGEDVMIFTNTLTVEEVERRLKAKGKTYGEIYEVPDQDVQYYIYEPCWID